MAWLVKTRVGSNKAISLRTNLNGLSWSFKRIFRESTFFWVKPKSWIGWFKSAGIGWSDSPPEKGMITVEMTESVFSEVFKKKVAVSDAYR